MKIASLRRVNLAVWALVGFFLLLIAAGASYQVWNARQGALAQSEAQATRFVAGAESALNRSLLAVDVLLAGLDDSLNLSSSLLDWIDVGAAEKQLRTAERLNLMIDLVALLDAQGRVIASSNAVGVQSQVALPPGFLEEVLAQPVSTLIVSAPAVSPVSSERVVYFARYVRLADGVRVVAAAQVPVAMIASLLMQGVDIAGLEVTLERSNGQLLLGVADDVSSDRVLSPIVKALTLEGRGRDTALARLSNVPALLVGRPILFHDLWITASIPVESALRTWRADRNTVVATILVFALMVALAGALVVAYLHRINMARRAMAESRSTLNKALESMVSGFLLLDAQLRVVQWNQRFEVIFPWLVVALAPQVPFRELLVVSARYRNPGGDDAQHMGWVDDRLELLSGSDGAHEQILPNGRHMQVTERVTPDGGYVITYHDVTDLRLASAEIESLAFYDSLTGLPNRRLLLDRLSQAAASGLRSGQTGSLLFLDLDKFKPINDCLGHEVGDQLLMQVADRLRACVRDSDTVARLGGDEFVVMLTDLSVQSHHAATLALHIGEQILRALEQPYRLGGSMHRVTCSLGATLFGQTEQNAAELLKQADIAMYQVKARRGNAMCFFDPSMQASINELAKMESDLQLALDRGEFVLHYQPQFALTGRMVGAEVLLRWQHPQRGMVPPCEFIAVAEERGLIIPIGLWVLRTACQQLAAWAGDARYGELQLSVNVSARQFRQPDFVQQVVEVVEQTGIQPHLLTLELTESLMLDNVDDCIAKMDLLKIRGVRFSVDDFGTGYSSLAYLTRLPLDQLKIDQSFVHNLGVRHTDAVIVQTIIGMASNLGLEVIAEGVETQAQKDLLVQHGCPLYQGYLLARPAPVHVLEAMQTAMQAPDAPLAA